MGIGFFMEARSVDRIIKDREDHIEKRSTTFGNINGRRSGIGPG